MPEEKDSPAPVRTNTPHRSSVSIASRTESISAASAGLMALRFSGLFSVTQAIPFSICTRTFLPPGSPVSPLPFTMLDLSSEYVIALHPDSAFDDTVKMYTITRSSANATFGPVRRLFRFLCNSARLRSLTGSSPRLPIPALQRPTLLPILGRLHFWAAHGRSPSHARDATDRRQTTRR